MVDADLGRPRDSYSDEDEAFRDRVDDELEAAHDRGEHLDFTRDL